MGTWPRLKGMDSKCGARAATVGENDGTIPAPQPQLAQAPHLLPA